MAGAPARLRRPEQLREEARLAGATPSRSSARSRGVRPCPAEGLPPRPPSHGGRRWALRLPLAAVCACRAAGACGPRFVAPAAGAHATDHNGVELPVTCFGPSKSKSGRHHVFVIGDWGGPMPENGASLKPADNTHLTSPGRDFVSGIDDSAQVRVAKQMIKRAPESEPDYILNVGDAFYWGGINVRCGAPPWQHHGTGQWSEIFESVYSGPGLDGKQWLGVLGNHDYGGYHFTNGWDQEIGYTWTGKTGRWMLPAQYWSARVNYPDFSVDFYFVDSNTLNAWDPDYDMEHNICGKRGNPEGANCGPQGPDDVKSCKKWFADLWEEEQKWLDEKLSKSDASWQVVVTHFPADMGIEYWKDVAYKHGIDLIISGHRHTQEIHAPEDENNLLSPSAYIVSGGGGGITSEGSPDKDGHDDMYGFMDVSFSSTEIQIEAISHGGHVRRVAHVKQRGLFQKPPTTTTTFTPGRSALELRSAMQALLRRTPAPAVTPRPTPAPTPSPRAPFPATLLAPELRVGTRGADHGHYLLSKVDCPGIEMKEILDRETCISAALDLDLPVAKLRTIADQSRIEGCYFLEGRSDPMLWLSSFPRYTKIPWKHLCQADPARVTWT